jgi:hypothetical protein
VRGQSTLTETVSGAISYTLTPRATSARLCLLCLFVANNSFWLEHRGAPAARVEDVLDVA